MGYAYVFVVMVLAFTSRQMSQGRILSRTEAPTRCRAFSGLGELKVGLDIWNTPAVLAIGVGVSHT